jgi:hypothetical protein
MLNYFWSVYYWFSDIKFEIKYACQRVFKGYDDRSNWNLNAYYAEEINRGVLYMAEHSSGCPEELTPEKWKKILHQISFGFGSYLEMETGIYPYNDPEYKRLNKEFKKGMALFARWFPNLWD